MNDLEVSEIFDCNSIFLKTSTSRRRPKDDTGTEERGKISPAKVTLFPRQSG